MDDIISGRRPDGAFQAERRDEKGRIIEVGTSTLSKILTQDRLDMIRFLVTRSPLTEKSYMRARVVELLDHIDAMKEWTHEQNSKR